MKLVVVVTMIIHQEVCIKGNTLKLLTLTGEIQRRFQSISFSPYVKLEFLLQSAAREKNKSEQLLVYRN